MHIRRMKKIAVILFIGIMILIARLIQIQLVETESFSKHDINLIESSVKQRSQVLKLDDGRGKFYDRKEEPLAHEEIPTLVLFPFLQKMNWPAEKIADIIGTTEYALTTAVEGAKEPFVFEKNGEAIQLTPEQTKQINDIKIPGVFAVNQKVYNGTVLAEQLIGTTIKSDVVKKERYPDMHLSAETRIGNTGLQRTFDEFLLSEGDSKLVYHVDATGGPLFGVDVKYVEPANPMYPVKVITTLDKEIQEKMEQLVDTYKVKSGGLVLLDIETSEIVALVSRPAITKGDPNGIGATNLMATQKAPGSVFKTVTAAAAIEYEAVQASRLFNCDRTIEGDVEKDRPLGMLNFEESFAQSCNKTFAELATEMATTHPDVLEDYAAKLGLTGTAGWEGDVYHSTMKQLYREDKGKVWHDEKMKKDVKMIAKTSIGQQDVQTTPLAIANMMATIARGGEKRMVKAVSKVEFNNGTTVFDFPDQELEGKTISRYTAMKLQKLLRTVVTSSDGTGASLQSLPVKVAGKSGTAQTNIEEGRLNKWFAGYFPYDKPKYALVTVSLDTTEESSSMTKMFGEAVTIVHDILQ